MECEKEGCHAPSALGRDPAWSTVLGPSCCMEQLLGCEGPVAVKTTLMWFIVKAMGGFCLQVCGKALGWHSGELSLVSCSGNGLVTSPSLHPCTPPKSHFSSWLIESPSLSGSNVTTPDLP